MNRENDAMFHRRTLLAGAATLPVLAKPGLAQGRETSVIWMGWPDNQVLPVMTEIERRNQGMRLRVERFPFSEIFPAIDVRLQARTPSPDIFIVDGPLTAFYAVRRHLAEIEPIIGREAVQRYARPVIEQGSVGGKLMALPLYTSSVALFCNPAVFRAAGVPLPGTDQSQRMTWEETLELAKRLTNASTQTWGLVVDQADRPYQTLPFAQSKGASVLSADGLTATGHVDSPAFVDAMRWYGELYTRHRVSPPAVFDSALAREMWFTNRAAMLLAIDSIPALAGGRSFEWIGAPHPYFAGGRVVTPTGSWHIGVNPRGTNRAATDAFIRSYAEPDIVAMQIRLRGAPPTMPILWDRMAADYAGDFWKLMRYEIENTAVPRPATPGFREYEDILRIATREIMGGADAGPRLRRAAADIDREMQKYRG
jgi:multiple sugar transport system substrate-binding protein